MKWKNYVARKTISDALLKQKGLEIALNSNYLMKRKAKCLCLTQRSVSALSVCLCHFLLACKVYA